MSDGMELLGPQAALARLGEIRAKVASYQGKGKGFAGALEGAIGAPSEPPGKPLPGRLDSFAPMNPLAGGLQINAGGSEAIRSMVRQVAEEKGLDPALFEALVAKESSFDPNARSRAGAMGLTQLMPDTARELGVTNPFDPLQNLRGGATYLAQMLQKYDGNRQLALAAYNAGPGRVDRAGGVPAIPETQRYVAQIIGLTEAGGNP